MKGNDIKFNTLLFNYGSHCDGIDSVHLQCILSGGAPTVLIYTSIYAKPLKAPLLEITSFCFS